MGAVALPRDILLIHINGHEESIPMFVTQLGRYSVGLRLPWLRGHDVNLKFAENTLICDSNFCLRQYILTQATAINGISIPPQQ